MDDEPDIWRKSLSSEIDLWGGLPSEKVIRKSCGKAAKLVVYAYGGSVAQAWWDKVGNTINDIVTSALNVCVMAQSDGISAQYPLRKPNISGTTAPADRDPKGRYLSFEAIGKLIEACRRPHMLELLLPDLGHRRGR